MNVPPDLVALAALFLADRLLVPRFLRVEAVFWSFQALNLAAAGWFAVRGIAGLGHLPMVKWLVVAMIAFHMVMGFSMRSRARWEDERRRSERAIRQGRPPFED